MRRLVPLFAVTAALVLPGSASASCFCMMGPPPPPNSSLADQETKNPATSVFLLRDGTRTILTIEAAYEGPNGELSMIVPLPHAIEREHVRTISGTHFRRVDQRTAPRATHNFPGCSDFRRHRRTRAAPMAAGRGGFVAPVMGDAVEVLEEWDVDEYDVTLLSAGESTGLLGFLRTRGLELPHGAEPVLRAYIETDHRFALIQLDPEEAHVVGGQRVLSPIQLEYQSDELRVPVRLGTLNSPGEQELLLYVLSREGRFEMANRENVIAPSGARLRDEYEGGFGAFYQGLMEQVFDAHPGAAVTEYAGRLGGGRVRVRDVWWLGLDRYRTDPNPYSAISWRDLRQWTVTRIRHRYGTDLDDDLVLRPTTELRNPDARWPRRGNNFQVRFSVEHAGGSCPSFARQQRLAREWAGTSDALWATGPVWPGDALLDPLLGIEPGSAAPPQVEIVEVEEQEIAREVEATPEPAPEASREPATAIASSGCRIRPAGSLGPVWLLGAAALFLFRRRR
ncbi:MAG: DUF2330 domain-containing protein [Sandaracinaceae bacterium]